MVILSSNGGEFRRLSWEEYSDRRKNDGNFSEKEKGYFDEVCYLSNGKKEQVINFSDAWKDAYIKHLEEE